MSKNSFAADVIRRSYVDEATKAVLLGGAGNAGSSFGLILSRGTTFKASALEAGPVELIPGKEGATIIPLLVVAACNGALAADVAANIGWLAPPDAQDAHDEPWLTATPTLFFGGEDAGSIVILPSGTNTPQPQLWPDCTKGRSLVVALPAVASRSAKKKEDEDEKKDEKKSAPKRATAREGEAVEEPDVLLAVFYTVV